MNLQLLHRSKVTDMNEKTESLSCEYCKTSFIDLESLQQHLKLHSRRKPYKCDECEAKFSYNSTLEWHKKSHMGELPYQCSECGDQFNQKSILVWHKRKHWVEEETLENNTSKNILVNIADIYHSEQNSNQNSSVICDVTSTLNNSLYVTSGSTGAITNIIPISSTQTSDVVNNIGKRKYEDEAFEGRYQCEACEEIFQQTGDLITHVQTKHNMGNANPYYILAKQHQHRQQFITEKPYKCDLCMAGFKTEGHLRTHRQKHIIGRPFKCSKCALSFSDKLSLQSHERRHQAVRPHNCIHCGANFYKETHLQKHIKRHTGELA